MTQPMPLVSVITPTRNRSAILREAIESVLTVRRDAFQVEAIVIDDGSTDNTAQVAAAYPVIYLYQEWKGVSAARNAGLELAQGDFVAFLDDDDVWLPTNLTPQLRAFAEHPEYGAVFGQLLLTDERRVPFGDLMPDGPARSGWILWDMLRSWPQLGSVVVRRSVIHAVGGFDCELPDAEDWDWLLRIAERFPVGSVEMPVALFRQRAEVDEDALHRGLIARLHVLRRHTRAIPRSRWLWLQRLIWSHRGWYTARFMDYAEDHARGCRWRRAARCIQFALRTSPLHMVMWLERRVRTGRRSRPNQQTGWVPPHDDRSIVRMSGSARQVKPRTPRASVAHIEGV